MNLKLVDIVSSIVTRNHVTDKDIERTVLYLVRDDILQDVRTLRRIGKAVNRMIEYENTP